MDNPVNPLHQTMLIIAYAASFGMLALEVILLVVRRRKARAAAQESWEEHDA